MNPKEMKRLDVMQKLAEKRTSQKKAALDLGISTRQVKRLWKAYRKKGAAGLISQQRGKASHNRLSEDIEQAAVDLLHSRYADFGPTLAQEKLVEKDGLKISVSSVRKLMIEEKLWKAKKARKVEAYQMRERRSCFGELVQIDGSPYDWFEGRAPKCSLLVFIDDATGKLVQLLFAESESFFSYCLAAESYFTRCGKPSAFYSDKHGIFRVNQPAAGSTDALTQFGRAMQELQVQIICANTPQAKGRVERANQTLQDRLPKELRLRGISDWDAGNAFLPDFIDDFNTRFAVQPKSSHDAHRPLSKSENLAQIFTWQESRILSNNLTIQFRKVVYQIHIDRPSYSMRKAPVTIALDANDNVTISYKGNSLPFTTFHKQSKQSEIVQSKHVDSMLKYLKPGTIPGPNHPWRMHPNNQNAPKRGHSNLTDSGDIST